MTIVEHIQELRSRLLKAIAGLLIGTILGFMWYQATFTLGPWKIPFTGASTGSLHFNSLGELLKEPYCALPEEQRFGNDGECRLLATSPFEMFMLRMKVGALAGLVLSSPWWLYQIWAYVTPGLVRKERRFTLLAVSAAALLFAAGAVLAYFVVSYGLEFFLQMGANAQIAALTGERYFNFFLALILIFGVSFELPLFIIMLNVAGVLHYETMKDKRRIIILLLFIFAAFMTPGQEPVSMLVLALSLTILMEVAIQFTRINDKRRNRERPEWLDLDDEQASPLAGNGGIGAPTPVEGASPITTSQSPMNSTPPVAGPIAPPAPVQTERTDLRQRPASDFDDVL